MNRIEKQAENPRRQGRLHGLLSLLALTLLLLPQPALAAEVFLPEIGLSLDLPASLDVFTQGMSPNDPLLKLKGQSAEEVRAELAAQGLSLKALDIAGAYAIYLSTAPDAGTDFSELDEAELGEMAGAFGAEQFEILRARQAAFLLLKNSREASCLTRVNGRLYTLRLTASSSLRDGYVKALRGIAQSMDFGLRQ